MKTTRTTLGALAIGLGSIGLLAACAPDAPPATTAPSATVTSTKTVTLSCNLGIYQGGNLLFNTVGTYPGSVLTLTADSAVAANSNVDYTATVTGIKNGPLAGVDGAANVEISVGGAASADSPSVALGAAAPSGPILIPAIDGAAGPISGATSVAVTKVEFTANGANAGDGAVGACVIPAADQPSVTVGNL